MGENLIPPPKIVYRFCTYFDSNYIVRFLPMYESLRRHCCGEAIIYTLVLDTVAEEMLACLKLAGVHPLSLSQIESRKDLGTLFSC